MSVEGFTKIYITCLVTLNNFNDGISTMKNYHFFEKILRQKLIYKDEKKLRRKKESQFENHTLKQ